MKACLEVLEGRQLPERSEVLDQFGHSGFGSTQVDPVGSSSREFARLDDELLQGLLGIKNAFQVTEAGYGQRDSPVRIPGSQPDRRLVDQEPRFLHADRDDGYPTLAR